MDEIWNSIEGYTNYQISSLARVKNSKTGRIIKQHLTTGGYYQVSLYCNGVRINYNVHKLVAVYFIANPENRREINHKNGIKTDNSLENLEWCTRRENIKHAYDTGLFRGRKSDDFEERLTKAVEMFNEGKVFKEIYAETGINQLTLNNHGFFKKGKYGKRSKTEELLVVAKEMRQNGATFKEIAKTLKISKDTLWRYGI